MLSAPHSSIHGSLLGRHSTPPSPSPIIRQTPKGLQPLSAPLPPRQGSSRPLVSTPLSLAAIATPTPPHGLIEPASPQLLSALLGEDLPLDHYALRFMSCMREENAEREISFSFKASTDKLSSPFASVRREGLSEALEKVQSIALTASMEVNKESTGQRSGRTQTLSLPFDAVLASSLSPAASVAAVNSESWDRVQRALKSSDCASQPFRRILVPSAEVRARIHGGMPVNVELSDPEALVWSTVRPAAAAPTAASLAQTNCDNDILVDRLPIPTSAASSPKPTPASLQEVLTAVTYDEQELALRLLQGVSLCCYHQRRSIADGYLFYYASEVWQCFLRHVEALYQQRRRLQLLASGADVSTVNGGSELFVNSHLVIDQHHSPVSSTAPPGAVEKSVTAPLAFSTSSRFSPMRLSRSESEGPVEVDEGLLRVVIALIDAMEAACHYNPPALTRLVQTGGVKALMNLAYSPCVPVVIRASVLDAVSVLMQEVAPFRRPVGLGTPRTARPATMSSGNNQAAGGAQPQASQSPTARPEEDGLLQDMIYQSVTGAFGGASGAKGGAPPFYMDRASASKFDSAVREWLSHHGLSSVVSGILELRSVKDLVMMSHVPKTEVQRLRQRGNQLRLKKITALLQAIDGKSTELK